MFRWLNLCLIYWVWFCALPAASGIGPPSTTAYTWHPQEGRLQKITSGFTEITYTRHTDSALLHRTESRQANNLRLTSERTFDFLERLTDLTHTGPPAPAAFGYAYNAANQRTSTRQSDGTTWAWDYDSLGQLQNANLQRTTDSALLPGCQYHYQYDSAGNRLTASQGDTANPAQHPQSINYQPSTLNQYTGLTHPAYAEVSGEAHPTATVTANGEPTNRLGPYFHKRLPVSNTGTDPVFTPIAIAATENGTTETESRTAVTLPASESPEYDEDGNHKQDALWTYTWDAENRLTGMESRPSVPAAKRVKLAFTYDSQHRRIRKQVWQAQSTAPNAWIPTQDRKFHYQGWNLIAEADLDKTFVRTYLWGLDLSGTFTGAGGTGGLLAVTIARGPAVGTHLVTTDGQGNVTGLINAITGQPTAAYTYDPFGQLLSATGPAAAANPIRFSTRYEDPETSLLYYGYRFLHPASGRWLNRDPLGEDGGVNLYGFVGNDPSGRMDKLGLVTAIFPLFPPDGTQRTGTTADTDAGHREAEEKAALLDWVAEVHTAWDAFSLRVRSADREGLQQGEPTSFLQSVFGTSPEVGLCGYDFTEENAATIRSEEKLRRIRQILHQYAGLVSSNPAVQMILVEAQMAEILNAYLPIKTYMAGELAQGRGPGELPGKVGFVSAGTAAWDNPLVQAMLAFTPVGLPSRLGAVSTLGRVTSTGRAGKGGMDASLPIRGSFGGELYDVTKMDRLAIALNKHGVGLVRDADDFLAARGMAAGFHAIGENTGLMFLKSNATVREVIHELVHFRQFRELGFNGYQSLRRTGGHETGVWKWFQSHPDKMGRLTNAESDAELMNFFNWKR